MLSNTLKIKAFSRLIISAKFKYIYGSLRRRFIFYFARGYFNAQMSRRRGACSIAGHCCKITLPQCPYLENGRCSIYDKQPLFCKIFPVDEKDKELSEVKGVCGYYFENE